MDFDFTIDGETIQQIKQKNNQNENLGTPFCNFHFLTSNWKHLEKYAIFWTRKGKSTIRYITKRMTGKCQIPEMILNDLFFYIQIYANDKAVTNKIKVFTLKDATNVEEQYQNQCFEKERIDDFLKEMENKIDEIIYDDGKILIFYNNKLIRKIDLVDEKLIERILKGVAPKLVVETATQQNSDLPISSKMVFTLLKTKVNITDLASVAFTGDYNDLNNIPNKFPPTAHKHQTNDIENWDDTFDEDLGDFIDDLIENIKGE